MMNREMEEESVDDLLASKKKESYLPSWILDMRKNLEKSKSASKQADEQINGILHDVVGLTNKLNAANEETKQHQKNMTDQKVGVKVISRINVLDLPDDTLCVIFQYLTVEAVMNVESTRKEARLMIESSNYWLATYSDQVKRFKASRQSSFRDFIVGKQQLIASSLTFIRVLKEKRSVPRFRNVEPHRYHHGESGISHPFPIVETKSGENGKQSISNTMMSRVETMNNDFRSFALLSMRDIFEMTSYEADHYHLKLVECGAIAVLVSLLSSESDVLRQCSCESLANILCWETRTVLNYERFSYLYHATVQYKTTGICNDSRVNFLSNAPLSHQPLRNQFQICDARRQLSSLLTSPSACVNLTQSRERGRDINKKDKNPSMNRMTSAVQGLASKAACRALLNLFSASDCLPSPYRSKFLFGDNNNENKEVKETHGKHTCEEKSGDIISLGECSVKSSDCAKKSNNRKHAMVSSTNSRMKVLRSKSLSVTSRNAVKRHDSQERPSKVNGNRLRLNAENSHTTNTSLPTSQVHTLNDVLNVVPCHPWKFVYYHKSGFVKDTHIVWLQFLDETMGVDSRDRQLRGRGVDDTGLFFLKGHVNVDIEGYFWYVEKCYIQKPVRSRLSMLLDNERKEMRTDVEEEHEVEYEMSRELWCENKSGEWIDKDEINDWGRPHIILTSYESACVTDTVVSENYVQNQRVAALCNLKKNPQFNKAQGEVDPKLREDLSYYESFDPRSKFCKNSINRSVSAKVAKERREKEEYDAYIRFNTNWGGGMFGVWEISTKESHFDLIKGGVFRAVQLHC